MPFYTISKHVLVARMNLRRDVFALLHQVLCYIRRLATLLRFTSENVYKYSTQNIKE